MAADIWVIAGGGDSGRSALQHFRCLLTGESRSYRRFSKDQDGRRRLAICISGKEPLRAILLPKLVPLARMDRIVQKKCAHLGDSPPTIPMYTAARVHAHPSLVNTKAPSNTVASCACCFKRAQDDF